MATNMRRLEGSTLADNASRTVTAIDTAAADHADFINSHGGSRNEIVYGAGAIYLMAAHNQAAGSITGHMVFYDRDGAVIAMGSSIALAATVIQASVKDESGVSATRNLSATEIEIPSGAYRARFYVTSLVTSTSVDIFIAHDDGFSR